LHQQLGYMKAQMEGIRSQQAPADADAPPQQRQTRSPVDEGQVALNRSIIDSLDDAGVAEEVIEKITADDFPINTVMRDFLATSDHAAELAKAWADDPKEALRIRSLGEWAAQRAMEKQERAVSAKPAAPAKTTKAPPPVPTVGGRSSPSFDPEKASMEEFAVDWHARQAAKRR
jgi:hypothetical protein